MVSVIFQLESPQGSILGLLLFRIYVNDFIDDLECYIHLYYMQTMRS